MPIASRRSLPVKPSLSFSLFLILFVVLVLAGGASQASVAGQVVVRGAAWSALLVVILFGKRPELREEWPLLLFLLTAALLAGAQLVPLPPAIWQSLPGRAIIAEAAFGQDQPWRPLSMVPGNTINSASSLIVPLAVLVLLSGLSASERALLPGLLLLAIVFTMLIGLLQLSGLRWDNPLINDTVGHVSGTFANRNHFAVFLAVGCVLAPAWAILAGSPTRWRGVLALGAVILFCLTVVATGSRAGMLVGGLALALGLLLAWYDLRRAFRRSHRLAFPATIAAIVGSIAIFVVLSVAAGRADSISRALSISVSEDMRQRSMPTVLSMITTYFPAGSGLGGFDPIFRIHEPDHLLKFSYFNHAHNDFLEILLDAGVFGGLLLFLGVLWWLVASVRAWRVPSGTRILAKLGSIILLLVIVASIFDYPARTPLMMALIVVAGLWLNGWADKPRRLALPRNGQHL